jgi:hypothetical protein
VEHPFAMLVRGSDAKHHFEHLPVAIGDRHEEQSKAVQRMMTSIMQRK